MRANTFKVQVTKFVNENKGLTRQEYLKAFVEMGMKPGSASIYYFMYVGPKKHRTKKITVPAQKGPVRDPKTGRFVKKIAA